MLILYILCTYFVNKKVEKFTENTNTEDKKLDNRDPLLNRKYDLERDKELSKYTKIIGNEDRPDRPDIIGDKFYNNKIDYKLENNNEDDDYYSINSLDNKNNITDMISDKYLPYSSNIFKDKYKKPEHINQEYEIINLYKTLLDRQPSNDELRKNMYLFNEYELNIDLLKLQILNSPEYNRNNKMQSNDVESGLVGAIAKEDLLSKLSVIYNRERNLNVPKNMLLPLRDCYIHLQYNDYLFRAMLVNNNYNKFEIDVLDTPMLSKEKLLKLFNKYFLLSDLKSVGNDIKKRALLDMKNETGKVPEPIVNKGSDIKNNDTNIAKQLDKISEESNKVFNKDNIANALKNGNYKSEQFIRLYEPIKYKQSYKDDPLFRPPVCTTLGQRQLVQPVFENSKTLFQGTDIKESIENTQVGSIMPKFKYIEYQDINVS